jgi:O-antigen/teichoic acid export membrane protein
VTAASSEISETRAGGGFGGRIANDAFVYGLGGIANQAVAILLVPIYARVLGTEGVGVTGVLNSIISLSLMLVGLALPQAFFRWYLREASDHQERTHVLGTTLAIRIAASLAGFAVVLLAMLPLTALLYNGANLAVFALGAPIVLFDSFNGLPLSFLRAERRPRNYVVIAITRAVTGTVLILFLVVSLELGVIGVSLGSAIAAALSASIGAWVLWRAGVWRPILDRDLSRAMLAFAFPLVPAAVAGWTLNLADRPLLQAFTGSAAIVGVYTTGYTAGLVINALAIQPFTLSWSTTFWEVSRSDDAPRTFARTLTWFLAIASAAALFLSAIGTDVIRLLFPPAFEESRFIVPFSAFGFVLYGAYTIVATGLNIVGRSGLIATSMIAAAAVAFGLNLVLIPLLGMYGAAISTVVGYGLLAILAGWQSQRHYPVPWQLVRAVVILGLAAALSALALLGPDNPLWRIGAILLYPPILIGAGIVRPTQARQLLRVLRRQ